MVICIQVQALRNEEDKQRDTVASTRATTPERLYSVDLDAFMDALEDYDLREQALLGALKERQKRASGKAKGKAVSRSATRPLESGP